MGKTLRAGSLRELTVEELKSKLAESRQRLFKLKVAQEMRQLNNPANLRLTRREIARLHTVVREKEKAVH